MEYVKELEALLEFSPVLIAAFAGLTMLFVQTMKSTSVWIKEHALVAILSLSVAFSALIVFQITWALQMAVLSYLLMTVSMGIYSGTKTKVSINLADMDEVEKT